MTNQYYVEPAGQALSGLGSAIAGKMIQKREAEEKEALQMKNKALVGEAQGLLAGNDIGALQDFMLANPAMGKRIDSMMNFKDDKTRANATETGFKIMSGSDPRAAIMERAEFIQANEGDPTQTLQMLEAGPKEQENWAKFLLAQNASKDQISALKDMQGTGMTDYQAEMISMKKAAAITRKDENESRKLQLKLSQETNELKRQELQLKLDEKIAKIAKDKVNINEKALDAITTIETTMDTLDRVRKHPGLESAAGFGSNFMTMGGSDASGFESQLETLQSQQFLSEIKRMKGMGSLSESEGKKLASAVGSLSLDMSDVELKAELDRIYSVLDKAKQTMIGRLPKGAKDQRHYENNPVKGDTGGIDRSKYSNSALKYIDEAGGGSGSGGGGAGGSMGAAGSSMMSALAGAAEQAIRDNPEESHMAGVVPPGAFRGGAGYGTGGFGYFGDEMSDGPIATDSKGNAVIVSDDYYRSRVGK